jgi:hypothetical protein
MIDDKLTFVEHSLQDVCSTSQDPLNHDQQLS